ncbi:MAG: hypothetical protein IKV77_09140 [Alistipes sp.]|nr:hypothetical protein [Alistipes sp.]
MKKIICAVSVLMVSAVVVIGLCSSTSKTEVKSDVCTEVSCQGKHCNGTVGCDCPGFSPKTNGDEWEKAYCRHCGHHRRSHK